MLLLNWACDANYSINSLGVYRSPSETMNSTPQAVNNKACRTRYHKAIHTGEYWKEATISTWAWLILWQMMEFHPAKNKTYCGWMNNYKVSLSGRALEHICCFSRACPVGGIQITLWARAVHVKWVRMSYMNIILVTPIQKHWIQNRGWALNARVISMATAQQEINFKSGWMHSPHML